MKSPEQGETMAGIERKQQNSAMRSSGKGKGQEPRLILFCEGRIAEYTLAGRQTLGRRTKTSVPDLEVSSLIVSRSHGEFNTKDGRIEYQDSGSKNGTYMDGRRIPIGIPIEMKDGTVLQIHAGQQTDPSMDVLLIVEKRHPEKTEWKRIELFERLDELKVGRGEEIFINDRTASRNHASFVRARNGWAIVDNNSLNGVFLNGKRIHEPVLIQPLDVIRIAKHLFIFRKDEIFYQADAEGDVRSAGLIPKADPKQTEDRSKSPGQEPEESGEKRLNDDVPKNRKEGKPEKKRSSRVVMDPVGGKEERQFSEEVIGERGEKCREVIRSRQKGKDTSRRPVKDGKQLAIHIRERVVWNRLRKKVILKDIDLTVESGSLVLILGGSGAGKTTFMNAVMGYEPANGTVSYGGADIYHDYEKMKYEIGYVPQQDLLRMEDIVYDTLENAARMRLPEEVFLAGGERYVEYTLNMFGLIREQNTMVSKLSGGQRKRLSIAVEYIGNPSLFFLDEPDSGLDGIMAKDLMLNLRQIADQGKIVMVISHSPDRAFELFDKVVVLAKSATDDCGHLVYYGAPSDACRFFETNSLEEIVGRINRRDEGGEGLADLFIQRFRKERGE